MKSNQIKKYIGSELLSIVDAMERIDDNAKGILFIVDEQEHLIGCLTDGDIRRWLIKTGELNASVTDAMVCKPKYLRWEERHQAANLMNRVTIKALPLLDKNHRIIDIILQKNSLRDMETKRKADLTGMPVIIMAGGKGTRLYPYTKILPKPLIPIGDTPIMERIINSFSEYGVNKFYVTVNYKKSMIKSYFSELNPEYKLVYIEENKPLGTGGSIRLIEEKFDRALFVTNSDVLILADYGDIYDFHIQSGNNITIVSALKNIVVPYGVLHSGENGELREMEEKPKISYFINTGMYVINPEVIEKIPNNTFFHMTDLVDVVKDTGGKVGTYPVSEDSFLDMGEFGEMRRMEEKLNIGKE